MFESKLWIKLHKPTTQSTDGIILVTKAAWATISQ